MATATTRRASRSSQPASSRWPLSAKQITLIIAVVFVTLLVCVVSVFVLAGPQFRKNFFSSSVPQQPSTQATPLVEPLPVIISPLSKQALPREFDCKDWRKTAQWLNNLREGTKDMTAIRVERELFEACEGATIDWAFPISLENGGKLININQGRPLAKHVLLQLDQVPAGHLIEHTRCIVPESLSIDPANDTGLRARVIGTVKRISWQWQILDGCYVIHTHRHTVQLFRE